MNPGKLNHRIKFSQQTGTPINEYGGSTPVYTPAVCSDTVPTDVTWGSLEPIKQWNQAAIEAGANILNGDKVLIIRYRKNFTPTKSMIFEDLNNPGDIFTVHSILPYYPGSKSSFENNQQTVYKDQVFVFILGKKRDKQS
jgi:head-tail adaptor